MKQEQVQVKKSLYVAKHEYSTLTKIGVAINPMVRLNQLKNQAGAELKIYYESDLITNYLKVEAEVLNHFKDKRILGEWLNETPQNIIDFIKTLDFNSMEYACLSCLYEDYTGEIVQTIKQYEVGDTYNKIEAIKDIEKGLYITDEYKYYIFIQQSKFIYQISFNVYRTALKFYKNNIDRVIKIDLETRKFINNPKFSTNNE